MKEYTSLRERGFRGWTRPEGRDISTLAGSRGRRDAGRIRGEGTLGGPEHGGRGRREGWGGWGGDQAPLSLQKNQGIEEI